MVYSPAFVGTPPEPIYNPEYSLHALLTSRPSSYQWNVPPDEAVILQAATVLTERYANLLPRYEILDAYYRGDPPLPNAPVRITEKFRQLQLMARSNWCGLVVDVVDERLRIDAVRSTAEPVLDETLWGYWTANNMDMRASEVHTEALKLGLCYVSVWPGEPGKPPRILGETPRSTYVECDSATHEPKEAIKIWFDRNDGHAYADYTTPEAQYRLISVDTVKDEVKLRGWRNYAWPLVDVAGVVWTFRLDVEAVLPTVGGKLPYVVFSARPDLLGEHHSEIEGLLPIQDRINKTTFDRLVTQETTAFPQRWVTGIDIPEDPVTGKPKEPFDAAVDRIWTLSHPDGKFGQFPQSSPEGYLQANTADIQAMATQSRTPPHYLIAGMGQFPSGESVRATEYGLTRKINSRQLAFGDPWGDVLRMCAMVDGEMTLATDPLVNVRWTQVEAHSEAEVADAILKLSTLPDVPIEPLLARAGLDPSTFDYYRQRRAEGFASGTNATATVVQQTPPATPPTPIQATTRYDQTPDQ